ncbi:Site-specific DNA recombinase [Caloramator quimbayensis]|uniref:Site-specific DNA recombinase n=1 Tax=Caloramator quimbayensis TaxID=1147123 RepID=A0A1T4Y9R3_9CLOT|nr:recombinase family protein [Caloramator quimbayensis]SKA98557.1 Site-specific DNA recombinase [Caloramator quimbayensis]
MARYAYARVSDKEQHSDRQVTNIKKYYPDIQDENIFIDKITGKTYDRPEYSVLTKRILRAGDEIIFSELDRVGRTKAGIKDELEFLKKKGVKVRALDIPSTLYDAEGKEQDLILDLVTTILIEVYSTLAQQELERKEYRQRQGIEEAKKRGVYKGRKPIDVNMTKFADIYKRWKSGELKTVEARTLSGLKNNTFYRTVERYEEQYKLGKYASEAI